MTITEFLEARIAEDEKQVTKHLPALSSHGLGDYGLRVLAECAAKRAIIELARNANEVEYRVFDEREWAGAGPEQVEPWTGDAILYALAAVYKDYPDYQKEWVAQ